MKNPHIFKDGNRTIVVFEDLTDAEYNEIVSAYSSKEIASAKLEPLKEEKTNDIVTEPIYSEIFDNIKSDKEEAEVFKSINNLPKLHDRRTEEEARMYLKKKFSKLDANTFEAKLTETQKKRFLDRYDCVLTDIEQEMSVSQLIESFK